MLRQAQRDTISDVLFLLESILCGETVDDKEVEELRDRLQRMKETL